MSILLIVSNMMYLQNIKHLPKNISFNLSIKNIITQILKVTFCI